MNENTSTCVRPCGVNTGILWGYDTDRAVEWIWNRKQHFHTVELRYDPGEGAGFIAQLADECSWKFSEVHIDISGSNVTQPELSLLIQSGHTLVGRPAQVAGLDAPVIAIVRPGSLVERPQGSTNGRGEEAREDDATRLIRDARALDKVMTADEGVHIDITSLLHTDSSVVSLWSDALRAAGVSVRGMRLNNYDGTGAVRDDLINPSLTQAALRLESARAVADMLDPARELPWTIDGELPESYKVGELFDMLCGSTRGQVGGGI